MTSIVSFEPLFPEDRVLDPLVDAAETLIGTSQALIAILGTPLAAALLPNLRAMNSYYTNKIEAQHATPVNMEAALSYSGTAPCARASDDCPTVERMGSTLWAPTGKGASTYRHCLLTSSIGMGPPISGREWTGCTVALAPCYARGAFNAWFVVTVTWLGARA